jgi:MoxR-like ATPase
VDTLHDLELLLRSRYALVVVESHEPERVEEALRAVAQRLGWPFFLWSVTQGLRRDDVPSPVYDTRDLARALAAVEARDGPGVYWLQDVHRLLGDAETVRRLLDVARRLEELRGAIVMSAPQDPLPPEIERRAARFRLALPDAFELEAVLRRVVGDLRKVHDVDVSIDAPGLRRLSTSLLGLTRHQAERAVARVVLEDGRLTADDADRVIAFKRRIWEQEGVLEYVAPSQTDFEPAGLAGLKRWVDKRRRALTDDAKRFGLPPPRGIVLLGVQGCGKSLAARWIAHAWGLPLLRLEPGRLFEKWLGESEKSLDRALDTAERMAPCVLWIDEVEKGFAAGDPDTDGGVSQRVIGRLLGWLQDRKAPVFVAATCNRIDRLPPELMRKGRFDEVFFVDLPTSTERRDVFRHHLKERGRDPAAFDLDRLAAASEGFSGAEIEQAVVAALYTAFHGGRDIDTALVEAELRATSPVSVTRREEVEALRAWARGRAVPAGVGLRAAGADRLRDPRAARGVWRAPGRAAMIPAAEGNPWACSRSSSTSSSRRCARRSPRRSSASPPAGSWARSSSGSWARWSAPGSRARRGSPSSSCCASRTSRSRSSGRSSARSSSCSSSG